MSLDPLNDALVSTDQADYAPGSTATFTASGFGIGEMVVFSVAHVAPGADGVIGTADDALVHDLSGTTASWSVTDGGAGDLDGVANGVVVTSWSVNQDAANQAFVLTATNTAGETATAAFTDAAGADGVLQAPTGGQAHTGDDYNPTHWGVVQGDTITDVITGATDALVVNGTVQVEVKSSEHGNTFLTGTFDADGADNIVNTADDNSITFTWLVQAPDGGEICDTTVVAYQVVGGNYVNVGTGGDDEHFGLAIVNPDGSPATCDDDGNPNWEAFKDVAVSTSDGLCGDDESIPVESHGATQNTVAVDVDHAGQVLTYTVSIVNDGDVSVDGTDIVVTDSYEGGSAVDVNSISGVVFSGDDVNPGVFDPGETWTWTYTHEVTQDEINSDGNSDGLLSNSATASTVSGILPTAEVSTDVEVCYHPDWQAFKDVDVGPTGGFCDDDTIPAESNGATENTVAVDVDHAGQVLTYTVSIVNDGNVSIDGSDIVVTDSYEGGSAVDVNSISGVVFSGDDVNPGVFDPGETWSWTYTHEVTQAEVDSDGGDGLLSNSATVSTISGILPEATMTTDVEVCQVPTVTIEKNILCHDEVLAADQSINLLKDGDGKVTYQIVVSNTGNVTIGDPVITDSVTDLSLLTAVETGGTGTNGDGILDVGETWTYTYDVTWGAGSHTNTAEVQSESYSLDESDSAIYFGLNPHITLDKKTNGSDGPTVAAGSAITWTYDVTNDGNVDNLTGLVVTDNPAQTINAVLVGGFNSGDTNQDGNLDVGETWHFTASGIAVLGPYSNTATATTDAVGDDCGGSVTPTDDDGSSYTGTFTPGKLGLTAGFWSQHTANWNTILTDAKNGGNLVPSVLAKNEIFDGLQNQGKLYLGDANGNNAQNGFEKTLAIDTLDLAVKLVSASVSTKSDARLNLLQQAVASQLNVDNHLGPTGPGGPGGNPGGPDYGTDLLGTAVKWLLGQMTFEAGGTNAAFSVDYNTNGKLDAGDFSIYSKLNFSGFVATSSADWTSKFLIDSSNSLFGGDKVYATGEQLKNALEAYNQGSLVVSADGSTIAWNNGGFSDVQANTQDGLWKVLIDHGIGSHHA